jgi:protein-S-isoprenylcysteine O-methyltransferase Ste14
METTIVEIIINLYKQANVNGRFAYIFWSIFILIYIYSSLYDKLNGLKKINRTLIKRNFPYTLYVFGALSIALHHGSIYYNFIKPFPLNASLWITLGFILIIPGLIIVAFARATLDGYWGPDIYKYNSQESILITTGIYKKIRHPVYAGQFLLTLGTVFLINNLWIIFFPIVTFVINHLRALREEKDLLERFPSEFPDYRNTTAFYGIP